MTPTRKLHEYDKLWGAVAEAMIAAYALMSAGGKLSSYRPFTDVDGKDIVIDLAGGFNDIYIQVKCALGIDRNRRIGGTVRLHRDRIPSSPKFVYVFCLLDRRKMELSRIWVVPSDRWDAYEVTRAELGPRLVKLIRSAAKRRVRFKREALSGRWLELAA
jgi:hypothetical protein